MTKMIPFVIFFLIVVLAFLVFSLFFRDHTFVFLSSMALILLASYGLINGILDLNNWFTQAISTALIGVGIYLMVVTSLDMIRESEYD